MGWEKYGMTNGFLKWVNIVTMVLSIPIIAVGIWLVYEKGGECETFLQKPVLVIGIFIFVVSFIGFVGAVCTSGFILWMYLFVMGLLIVLLLAFTLFAFIVAGSGNGTDVANQKFKEYNLKDYSSWLRSELNNTHNWNKIESCFSAAKYCRHLGSDYSTVADYLNAKLSPTESGCCRPPAECGFRQLNATYFTVTAAPASANPDCLRFNNNQTMMCFSCDSCKGGFAQYIKDEWNTVAIVLIIVLVFLIICYIAACFAKNNADRDLTFERMDKSYGV